MFNVLPGVTRLTADGQVGATGRAVRIYSVHLVSGGTGSTTTLCNGTLTVDTVYAQIDGTANKGVTVNFEGGLLFPSGCHMNTDANISFASIVFSQER